MTTALDSHALGTDRGITRCGDDLRPAEPQLPPSGRALGVTLSGGGFRATLAALGVIRYLADANLLSDVRYCSSVSGGSIANGLLALHWPQLRAAGFTTRAVDDLIVDPFVRRISRHSLKGALLGSLWRLAKPGTARTDLLARDLDDWFFDGRLLEELDSEVRWVINAANVITGVRFTFERDVVGDYVTGLARTQGTGLRLAQAAAASASVPGPFSAWPLPGEIAFPCPRGAPMLLDGGVYDNTGLEVIDGDRYRDVFTVTMNAGGLLRVGGYGKVPIVRDLARANALLYRQSTALRTRAMVERFLRGDRSGVLVALGTVFAPGGELAAWSARFPDEGAELAGVPTVFDKLDEQLCRRLVRRGWWLIGAAMAAYHPDMAPDPNAVTPP